MKLDSSKPSKHKHLGRDTLAVRGGERRQNGHDAVTMPIVYRRLRVQRHPRGRIAPPRFGWAPMAEDTSDKPAYRESTEVLKSVEGEVQRCRG